MKLKLFIGIALIALAGPVQAGEPDANEIIRSLAPITYLPVHGGKPYRAIDLAVTFSSGSAVLTPEARQMLNQLGHALQSAQLRSSRFEVAGHTDASGSRQLNQALSDKRAKAVVRYLTKRFGIERSRLNAVGKGENELRDPLNPRPERHPVPLASQHNPLKTRDVAAQPVRPTMSLRSTRTVHQRRPALRKLDHPPVLHRVDATQRQIDLPNYPSVIGVDDFRNPTEVLDDLPAATQQRVELLPIGVTLLLAVGQVRREVHEHHQRGRLRVALPKDPPDRIAAAIGSHFIGSTCRRGTPSCAR